MQQLPNPVANIYQTQLEASRRFADAIFSGTEKLDRVVIEATHRAITEQLNFAKAMASGTDLRNAGPNLAGNLLQRNSDGAANYQAEIIRIVAEMQSEIGNSMKECMEQFGSQAASAPTQAARAAQPASDAMYNPVTSMLSVWESAFKEATAMATRNMAAARANAERAVDTAGNYTRSATRAAESAAESTVDTTRKAAGETENGKGSRRR